MKVQMKLDEGVEQPFYATGGSAALDVKPNIEQAIMIKPNETLIVPTGVYVSMPKDIALLVMPRSGHSYKGLRIANAPGLVDSDYTDEIGILAYNSTGEAITINPQKALAQFMFVPVIKPEVDIVLELQETDRKGGFGHTDGTGVHEAKEDPLGR